jgi:hypothetical protein
MDIIGTESSIKSVGYFIGICKNIEHAINTKITPEYINKFIFSGQWQSCLLYDSMYFFHSVLSFSFLNRSVIFSFVSNSNLRGDKLYVFDPGFNILTLLILYTGSSILPSKS